mmetsp:Transcript_92262/g.214327  ORF Transcript_92262/g.214327 Transcript_92262/m.214327 type:complete len:269 (+) Transcript_92262:1795-2601(+)
MSSWSTTTRLQDGACYLPERRLPRSGDHTAPSGGTQAGPLAGTGCLSHAGDVSVLFAGSANDVGKAAAGDVAILGAGNPDDVCKAAAGTPSSTAKLLRQCALDSGSLRGSSSWFGRDPNRQRELWRAAAQRGRWLHTAGAGAILCRLAAAVALARVHLCRHFRCHWAPSIASTLPGGAGWAAGSGSFRQAKCAGAASGSQDIQYAVGTADWCPPCTPVMDAHLGRGEAAGGRDAALQPRPHFLQHSWWRHRWAALWRRHGVLHAGTRC